MMREDGEFLAPDGARGHPRLDEKAESAASRLERMVDSMPYGKDNA
jgi:hypothetical protein